MTLPRWLERSFWLLFAVGAVAGAVQVRGCQSDRELAAVRKKLAEQFEARARADHDRIQQLEGDSLEMTRRQVSTEASIDSAQAVAGHLVAALAQKEALIAVLGQQIAYRDSLDTVEGQVETIGDTLFTAQFHHESQVLDAWTEMTLNRLGLQGQEFTAHEQLTINSLRLPLETALVMLDDGSIEARSTCAARNCGVANLHVPIFWVRDLIVQLEEKRPDLLQRDSGGIGPVGYMAVGGGIVGAGILALQILAN